MIDIYNKDCQDILPRILENIDREKVIFVSDPPFNIGYHYNYYKDNLKEEEYYEIRNNLWRIIRNYIKMAKISKTITHEQFSQMEYKIGE